jgi:hypothetical protein
MFDDRRVSGFTWSSRLDFDRETEFGPPLRERIASFGNNFSKCHRLFDSLEKL